MNVSVRTVRWLAILVLAAGIAPDIGAQAARVSVNVNDAEGKPLPGVTLTVTCAAKPDYRIVKVTDRKGRTAVTHLDSLKTYTYRFEKDGYQIFEKEVQADYTQTNRLEVVLVPSQPLRSAPGEGRGAARGGRALVLFNEGTEAQKQGNLGLAEAKFRQAAELSPDAPQPHIALAVVAHERGDHAAAAAEAEAALAISPNNAQALFLRYDAYRLLGNEAKAAEAADALRQAGQESAAASQVFSAGLADYQAGNTDEAVAKFRQALDLDPKLVNAHIMLATISLAAGDPREAAAEATRAVEIEPSNTNALKVRYDALRAVGDPAAAHEALDALIAADPQWASTELFNHAVELYNGSDMVGAAAAFERVVELHPDDARAHFLLGMADYNLGKPEEARVHLSTFLELAPDDPDAALAREVLSYPDE